MLREILIANPQPNTDQTRFATIADNERFMSEIDLLVSAGIFNPLSHPRILHICAGEGYLGNEMEKRGWSPNNIYCFDIAKPTEGMLRYANWLFLNIRELLTALRNKEVIPDSISMLAKMCNIVFSVLGETDFNDDRLLFEYFATRNAIVTDYPNEREFAQKYKSWTPLTGTSFMRRK